MIVSLAFWLTGSDNSCPCARPISAPKRMTRMKRSTVPVFSLAENSFHPWLKNDPLEYLYPSVRETRILSLAQNYPNPLGTGSTNIRYSIPNDSEPVSLVVYDVNGRRIRVLVDDVQTAGEHFVKWDGKNEHGKRVAPGIYFYRLKVGGASLAKKMILLY